MADLVGFTRFTEQHGDAAAHEQASRLVSLARAAAATRSVRRRGVWMHELGRRQR